jgi:acyl dehydratase
MEYYYEDIELGRVYKPDDRYEVTKSEIKEFAEQYDPQPFHIDEEAARDSFFGSLVASGWHTASMCMRLIVDGLLESKSSMGARGIDELRWLEPVFPGDTLRIEVEITEKRPSESRPEMGHVHSTVTGFNQHENAVIEFTSLAMYRRREPAE